MEQYMVTTTDNPYDPFTQFEQWYQFDTSAGYHTLSFLGRIVRTSDDLSELDQSVAIRDAVQEICRENVLGLYKMVVSGSS
jgi:hypothetical protein